MREQKEAYWWAQIANLALPETEKGWRNTGKPDASVVRLCWSEIRF